MQQAIALDQAQVHAEKRPLRIGWIAAFFRAYAEALSLCAEIEYLSANARRELALARLASMRS